MLPFSCAVFGVCVFYVFVCLLLGVLKWSSMLLRQRRIRQSGYGDRYTWGMPPGCQTACQTDLSCPKCPRFACLRCQLHPPPCCRVIHA